MVCTPLKIYLVFIIVQNIISAAEFKTGFHVLSALLNAGIIYLLCHYQHVTIANWIVGITIVLGVLVDIFALSHKGIVKKAQHEQAKHQHRHSHA